MDGWRALGDVITLGVLVLGLRKLFADVRTGTRLSPRGRVVLRVARLVTYGAGILIILASFTFAARNIRRIVAGPAARGVITYVQHSKHTFTPWSYYVKFNAGARQRQEFAYTSTVFARKQGDAVRVVYDASDRTKTEIIACDADWVVGCGVVFVAGLLMVSFAVFVYGWWS